MNTTEQQQQQLHDIAEQVLGEAKKLGASSAEVSMSISTGYAVTVRMGEVETVEYHNDKGLGVTVYFGHKKGAASSTDTSAGSIKATIQAACDIAKFTGEDTYSGLADKDMMAFDYPDLDLFHPWDLAPEAAIDMAKACEDQGRAFDERICNSDGAVVSTGNSNQLYANSHGFVGIVPTTRHSLSCMLVAKANEQMQRDYYYSSTRSANDLLTADEIAERAARRTVERLNARKIPTCEVPVLFEPEIAKTLFRSFIGAIRGGALYRKSTFLLDMLNKSVFADHINIYERPHILKGNGSAPFDAEGVKTCDKDFIREGILKNYCLGSYSARRLKMQSTGNAGGVHNLLVDHHDVDQAALIKQMDRGLIVRELLGHGVNLVTGDYSRGASGFWVENGEIQYPVEEITIAGNLRDMFLNIVAVGNDIDRRSNIHCGSVLLSSMTIAGE